MSRLKIKRNTTNSDAPENTQLVRGELAFNDATESLYIGKGTSGSTADEIVNLGGKGLFLALTGAQTAAGNKTFSGNLTVGGNLTVNGTTTTVNSTTTTVDDPVFTLGGDSAPGSDDNKDRGIEFRYHDGSSARVGFFGYDDSASAFTFLTAATNSSEVFSGTVGNVTGGIGTFSSLDISGAIDVDGTTNLDAVDIDGAVQIDSTVTVGVNDTGYDVKFFGATSGAYLLWDESADKLLTAGGAVVDIVKDKLLIGGTAVTTTAAELNVLDAVTGGTVTANLAVVVDSNKDIGSFRNITLTGELDAGSLDVSGDADIDGTLEADAITVNGSTLSSVIQDEATALAIALG